MSIIWNLWHGCHKKSEGCFNCYVYRSDQRFGRDPSIITKNQTFELPIQKNRQQQYKIKPNTLIYTAFTSDFLLPEADKWRDRAWDIIRERRDCHFLFLTKRIERFNEIIPKDWNDGWDHVSVGCTCENQKRADERLPIFLSLPIKHRIIICEPLLDEICLTKYLTGIDEVVVGGESGNNARVCDFDWVLRIRDECIKNNIKFVFKQTGARFKKGNKIYNVARKHQHQQAKKANINFLGD